MKGVMRSIVFVSSLLWLTGCVVQKDYVAADKATFDAIGPEYRAYVESDPKLDQDQKARRLRTLESWKIRLQGGTP